MCQSGKHASRSLILKWLILLSLAMAGLLASAHADSLNDGIVAYKNRNYPQATQLFATAARQTPGNANAYFYLGLSSTRQQQYALARQAFERVIQMSPPQSELAAKARNNISYLTNQQIALSGNSLRTTTIMKAALAPATRENYLTHVLAQGKVIRFTLAKMPLRVFISNGSPSQGWVGFPNATRRCARHGEPGKPRPAGKYRSRKPGRKVTPILSCVGSETFPITSWASALSKCWAVRSSAPILRLPVTIPTAPRRFRWANW
jgi:Tetratricopeptide repeat